MATLVTFRETTRHTDHAGSAKAPDRVAAVADPEALPAECRDLFTAGGAQSFFLSEAWFRVTLAHAMPPGATPCLLVAGTGDRITGLLPMQWTGEGGLRSLTTPYTCLYAPLLAPTATPYASGLAFGRFCRIRPVVRFDALDPLAPGFAAFAEGLAASGLAVRRFDHFGNWHEEVGGLTWEEYLAGRSGALRQTITRKLRRTGRDSMSRLEVISGVDRLEAGLAAYEAVYARSWKDAEPFPRFNPALIRAAAGHGQLRLGVYWLGETPIAVQFWVVDGGVATILKLAHDEAQKPLSPGTVLTACLIRRLIEEEGVREIDFGRGDDPYKQLWARQRRLRVGLLLADPRHPRGLAALGRHALGRLRQRMTAGSVA